MGGSYVRNRGMKELSLQALVTSAIRKNGGFAIKLANRFLVGVPDLMIQIPGYPTTLWEVKRGNELWQGTKVKFGLTPMQYNLLDRFSKAGGICGVMHFMVGKQHMYFGIFDLDQVRMGIFANSSYFTELPRGRREEVINTLVRREHERYHDIIARQGFKSWGLRPDEPDSTELEEANALSAGVGRFEQPAKGNS